MKELDVEQRRELLERLERLAEVGAEVRVEWYSKRAKGDGTVSREGELKTRQTRGGSTVPAFYTDETVSNYYFRPNNLEREYGEISVRGVSPQSNRQPSIGHLLDVEPLNGVHGCDACNGSAVSIDGKCVLHYVAENHSAEEFETAKKEAHLRVSVE